MRLRDHYQALGVSPRASWEEIRRSFRTLVRLCHPDLNPDDPTAASRFLQIMAAYEAIVAARAKSRRARKIYRASVKVSNEVFEEIFGISRRTSIFSRSSGADFRYDLRIPFTAALMGMETMIEVPRWLNCRQCEGTGQDLAQNSQVCPDCQGYGRRPLGPGLLRFGAVCRSCQGRGKISRQPCPVCQGQGHHLHTRQYQVNIPPGTEDGTRLTIAGEGGEGIRNGSPGNLEVVISVEPHSFFTRKGKDLYCQVKVSFAQAALGGNIRIPTLTGHKLINLPRGLQSGRIFRFPGAGVPVGPQPHWGDQIVEVVVTTPDRLSPTQRGILQELARLEQEELNLAAHE